ncbi:MAG: SDR family oxidoreductase [Candidatus Tectomicrobia bacterium]|uniref:SDR family oxidoreductase n=1 Tax=Tectimicrobiota bacterium TaxID=2528274 RepID=A0A933LQW5_UNCTE|nr:SDR family oxidoreductase [Candidatus Tectomicrobia bacterium]
MRLKDQTAIITGGAKGIGGIIARIFAKEGADLAIVDLDTENLKLVSQEIEKLGRRVVTARVDVSQGQEVRDFVAMVIERLGKVDILINCAAFIVYEKFLDFDEKIWRQMLDVDLTGYFLFSQAAAREMVKKRQGRIINIASVAADLGVERGAAYCASKSGVLGLTRVMALELAPFGINVNAVSPGPIETGQMRSLLTEEEIKLRARAIPLERFGQPEDIAKAVLFLASDESAYITGEILRVDGGLSGTRK